MTLRTSAWLWLVLAGAVSGCASTTVRQATTLAEAGVAYGAAGKEVIDVTRTRYLDWKALALIEELPEKPQCTPEELNGSVKPSSDCKQAMDDLQKTVDEDLEFISDLAVLSRHADALGRYFGALRTVAAYDAQGGTSEAISQLVDQVNELNGQLDSKSRFSDEQKAAWAGLSGLVGNSIKSRILRETLKRDAEAIGKAIDLQGEALQFHVMTLNGIALNARTFEYERNVKAAYLLGTAAADPGAWIGRRRATLLPPPEIEQLQKLQSASEALKIVWNDILAGRADLQAAEEVLNDVAGALKSLDDARRARPDES